MQKQCIRLIHRPAIPERPPFRRPRDFLLLLTAFIAPPDEPEPEVKTISNDMNRVSTVKRVSDLESMLYDAGDKLVVLFVMVRWCPFCRKIAPTVEEIANNSERTVVVLKVDMDDKEAESTKILARYGAFYLQQERFAVGLPTFIFLRSGQKLEHYSSADDGKLRGTVDKYTH